MKKILIFVSFVFIFVSCCFTSFEYKECQIQHAAVQSIKTMDSETVKKAENGSEYYIVSSTCLNLSQYFANLFDVFCAVIENDTHKKLNLHLVYNCWGILNSCNLKISYLLVPRAP